MKKFFDLVEKAQTLDLWLYTSPDRADRYTLFNVDSMQRTPDVPIDVIEEWLNALASGVETASTKALRLWLKLDDTVDEPLLLRVHELIKLKELRAELVAAFPTATKQIRELDDMIGVVVASI